MSAVLQEKTKPIAAYDEFRAELTKLRELNKSLVFDYEDPKGNKDARSHVYKLRQTRAAVDKARKDEKEESLAYGRRVDAEAKEIMEEIEGMIEVHAKPLAEIEEREKARVKAHEDALAEITDDGDQIKAGWMDYSAGTIRDHIEIVEQIPVTSERWEEYAERAATVKENALTKMRKALGERERYDAEQAELQRLREEAAEREAKEKAEREAAEKERREKEAQEREARIAEEAAERARQEAAAEKRREEEAAAKRAADEQHRKDVHARLIDQFQARAGLCMDDAMRVVQALSEGKIEGVSITY